MFQCLWKMKEQPTSLSCTWRLFNYMFPTRDRLIALRIPNVSSFFVLYNICDESACQLFARVRSLVDCGICVIIGLRCNLCTTIQQGNILYDTG